MEIKAAAQVGVLVTACIVFGGCGSRDGIDRVLVSGTVTYEGQPIGIGQIRFIPQTGVVGPITIERIEHGEYTTTSTSGVPVGKHRVEIIAYDPVEYANAPAGPGSPPIKQLLPEKYNVKSELEIELTGDQRKKRVDFNLE